ncbi:MAG: threonine ammonia-lyase [Bacteroidota bacterium]
MTTTNSRLLPLAAILQAEQRLKSVIHRTPLLKDAHLSAKYDCEVWLKREDLQVVRSYKLRGAYHRMSLLSESEQANGIICASAGNHAQGVAYACHALSIPGKIFMPETTPNQKVRKVQQFGQQQVEVILGGDTFDDAYQTAVQVCEAEGKIFIHPFDDPAIIAGQGTVGIEILADCPAEIDWVFMPVGGGGLSAGVGSYFKRLSSPTRLIGVEPDGAPAMYEAFRQNQPVHLAQINKFVDGAAVQQVGQHTFPICQEALEEIALVSEGKVCSTILELYDEEAIIVEPAGALSVAVLDQYREQIRGKQVVCIISGGNNDIRRMEEIKERALLYHGLKHYFIIRFPQRAGALRDFLVNVLGPTDDITHFEYTKTNNREAGPALVGLEVRSEADYEALIQRMKTHQINYELVNDKPMLFHLLV